MTKDEIREYKRQYARGWNASRRGSDGALERMDFREPNNTAWYDGYYDDAAGRDRYIAESGFHRITGEKQ